MTKTKKAEKTEAAEIPGRDKTLIWDDCPECAYKHLTAAYAAATSGSPLQQPTCEEVLEARAVIAIREAQAGYTGNADLAAGCLALAECGVKINCEVVLGALRPARRALMRGDFIAALQLLFMHEPAAFLVAHITEALRELPTLEGDLRVGDWYLFPGLEQDEAAAQLAHLRSLIKKVADTYELHAERAT